MDGWMDDMTVDWQVDQKGDRMGRFIDWLVGR